MLLPYIWASSSLPFRNSQFGKIDIKEPRVQAEQLAGAGARAWGAQSNAWEALAIFIGANLMALMAGVDPAGDWSTAALIWVAARISHGISYIANIAPVRVLSFAVGMAMSGWIGVLSLTV